MAVDKKAQKRYNNNQSKLKAHFGSHNTHTTLYAYADYIKLLSMLLAIANIVII